jgi:hypothetical protein
MDRGGTHRDCNGRIDCDGTLIENTTPNVLRRQAMDNNKLGQSQQQGHLCHCDEFPRIREYFERFGARVYNVLSPNDVIQMRVEIDFKYHNWQLLQAN